MFSVNNISVVFSGEELFSDISFNINSRDRIGLVGRNGAGKTTLLRIITGQMQAETGNISMPDGYTIGYLPQELESRSEKTVFEEALTAFSELIDVQKKLQKLRIELETDTVHDEKISAESRRTSEV
jgi:ATP-binding cassette, subfamily F, member 3